MVKFPYKIQILIRKEDNQMLKYQLDIRIHEKDLPTIHAAMEKIVIVKHIEGQPNVAWVSFSPFENNTIEWESEYSIYASSTSLQGGARIDKMSAISGITQLNHKFESAIFTREKAENPMVGLNTHIVTNNMQGYSDLTFGLAQNIEVNGKKYSSHPINAVSLPYQHSVEITPTEKIDVYLKSDLETSTIISHIPSVSLPIEYSENITTHTIVYDSNLGKFILETKK